MRLPGVFLVKWTAQTAVWLLQLSLLLYATFEVSHYVSNSIIKLYEPTVFEQLLSIGHIDRLYPKSLLAVPVLRIKIEFGNKRAHPKDKSHCSWESRRCCEHPWRIFGSSPTNFAISCI